LSASHVAVPRTSIRRVPTHLENLEKSGNLRVVREKSGKNEKSKKSQGKCVLACMTFGLLVLRKIIEIVATRCQILRLKYTKFDFGCVFATSAYSAPPDPLTDLRGSTSKREEGRNSKLFHWNLLKSTVVIVLTVYMSIAVRNNMHFVLYRYCCEGRYSVTIQLKCVEQLGKSQGI